jgi:peptidoglycan/xylan/chitin deacetylase (PgdA/CDA1 family)
MRPALLLAYHGLGNYTRALDPHNLMVDPARFRSQMSTLRQRGYRFVSLSQFAGYLSEGKPPDGVCAVTFDDGTVDNVELLAPLLAEIEVPVTVFVCPGLLGKAHFAMPSQAGVRLMNADELLELDSSPFLDIGSHTSTHADLSGASSEYAYREMASSKHDLEELLQRPVDAFAYPKCCYSSACPDAARRAGYSIAVTCGGLGGWNQFELNRESIDSLDRRVSFALKSRRLFLPLRDSLPGRLARSAVRMRRHGGAD